MKSALAIVALLPFIAANPMEARQATSSAVSSPCASTSGSAPSSTSGLNPLNPPACVAACLGHAQTAQFYCAPSDLYCFCNTPEIWTYIGNCVNSSCTPDEAQAGAPVLKGTCAAFQNSAAQ